MGYGDDLLVTKLASKIKKQFPDRQIVIGEAKNQTAYHSLIFDHNPNISDCRNLEKNKHSHYTYYTSPQIWAWPCQDVCRVLRGRQADGPGIGCM